jgi:hypothetical protein
VKGWDAMRYVVASCAAGALLAGCGGSQPPVAANVTKAQTQARSHTRTFKYTGAEQSFKVPRGVTNVTIVATGARGANGGYQSQYYAGVGGAGGSVQATIPVRPGERLAIFVGGWGGYGGFNGGGSGPRGCHSSDCFSIGGGASDVRQGADRLADRVVVAAGGGGGAGDGGTTYTTLGGNGGAGGGDTGGSGGNGQGEFAAIGGTGGTQSTGGTGGAGGVGCGKMPNGGNGRRGAGGHLGPACHGTSGNGGGGGGGYYGGGGGGGGGYTSGPIEYGAGAGGGGGSSFAESSATHVRMITGVNTAAPMIEISW